MHISITLPRKDGVRAPGEVFGFSIVLSSCRHNRDKLDAIDLDVDLTNGFSFGWKTPLYTSEMGRMSASSQLGVMGVIGRHPAFQRTPF